MGFEFGGKGDCIMFLQTTFTCSLSSKYVSVYIYVYFLIVSTFLDKMSETITGATKLIEQGHVRIGPELVKDPAFLVSRTLEDFVTWVDSSAIKKHVMEYNSMVGT